MKVKAYVVNAGTSSEFYWLVNVAENEVLYGAPNNWKTRKGAERWAERNGLKVVK